MAEGHESGVEGLLSAKGPGKIPAWGYGVGLAALFLGVEWYRNKNATPPPSTQPGTQTTTTVSRSGGGGGWPYWRAPRNFRPEWGVPAPSNDSQWKAFAQDWAESKGETPGFTADTLTDYLSGQSLSKQEWGLIHLIEGQLGPPPDIPRFMGGGGNRQSPQAVRNPGSGPGNVNVTIRQGRRRR